MHATICKNCEKPLSGNYCGNCGQSAHVERIDTHYFLHDIPHSVFHVDKGFWFTFKSLFINPGKSLAEYLAGKRINHFRPFAYVLILSAIYVFLAPQIEMLTEKNAGASIFKARNERPFFEKYISLLIFIQIPVLSLITWLSFKKAIYNYWEHFLINTYLAAQTNLLLLVIKIWGLLKVSTGGQPNTKFTFAMFIFMFYYSFTFVKLMRSHYSRSNVFIRLLIMNTLLAFVYITAFSLSGIMTPWWGK
jgi:hypothetical protein